MKRTVAEILSAEGITWEPINPPATEQEIELLQRSVDFELPDEYIELLRFANGGDGDLNAAPLMFVLSSISYAIKHNEYLREEEESTGFWFFGNNGGLEQIAFDLRNGPPWQIVAIDPVAGEESALIIANTMGDFILKMGHVHAN